MSRAEKIAANVICLTDVMPIDGRVSWLPPKASGFEAYNKNLVLNDDRILMIETGVACHGPSLRFPGLPGTVLWAPILR